MRLLSIPIALAATASLTILLPVATSEELPELAQRPSAASCAKDCRGLGIEKVKAGDEHCGLVSKERKDESLAAACELAEAHSESLAQLAEERAWHKCGGVRDQPGCLCTTELRSWQNVYTHVLSQRCWTECGWAFLVECEREPKASPAESSAPVRAPT